MAAAAPNPALQWSAAQWKQLVLRSASRALEARDRQLPVKEQLAHVLMGGLQVQPCTELDAQRTSFRAGVRARMAGSAEAIACMDAAFAACEIEIGPVLPGARCCFTGGTGPTVTSVSLFGNRAGRRVESVHVVGVPGFVEACMVVGNLPEQLDQTVDMALGAVRTLGPGEFDAVWARVEERTKAFGEAALYLYACVMGPLPVSHEEARQAALPAWEAQTDIHVLLHSLHTVLWEGTQWTPHPPTGTTKELKRAYKAAAKLVHPDKAPLHADEAARLFRVLQQAYESLSAF